MNQFSDISPEDRAIIVISVNFRLKGEEPANGTALYAILTEMFRKRPVISFFDFPLVYSVVQDFYFKLRTEDKTRALAASSRRRQITSTQRNPPGTAISGC